MFSLFNPPFESSRQNITLPLFDYLNNQTRHEVDKVVNFYKDNIVNAKTTDRLVKLLIELQSYMDLSPESLVGVIRNISARLCNSYNIVSPVTFGKISNQGEMYNRNNPELFIHVEYPFDVKKCIANYTELRPVRVVSHEFSDFSYGLCNGNYLSAENGIAIFTIDLAMLALQYQQWYHKERYVKERNLHLPTTYFVTRYIWTGLLSTHMDNVLFNRMCNRLSGKPNASIRTSQSMLLIDYGSRYDSLFDQLIERYKVQGTEWSQRLHTLPSLHYGTYARSISFPDTAPVRQIRWAMVLSKLRIVEFLLNIDKYTGNESINLSDREAIARELRVLRNDRSLEMFLPEASLKRIESVYTEVNKQQA